MSYLVWVKSVLQGVVMCPSWGSKVDFMWEVRVQTVGIRCDWCGLPVSFLWDCVHDVGIWYFQEAIFYPGAVEVTEFGER